MRTAPRHRGIQPTCRTPWFFSSIILIFRRALKRVTRAVLAEHPNLGDVAGRVAFVRPEAERRPFLRRELVQEPGRKGRRVAGVRDAIRADERRIELRPGGEFHKTALFPDHVERSPINDGQEPGFEAPSGVVPVEVLEDPEKRLLADILGIFAIPKDVDRHGRHEGPVGIQEPAIGLRPAVQAAGQDVLSSIASFRSRSIKAYARCRVAVR